MELMDYWQRYIENETHFLLLCPTYTVLRAPLRASLTKYNPIFQFYTNEEKLVYLMTNIDREVALFITQSLQLRDFLLAHHKRGV